MGKSEKQSNSHSLRKSKISFRKGCENFATLQKPIRTPCEKFTNPKLPCKHLCKIEKGVQTQFATLKSISQACANSKSPCKKKRSLKSLFKDLQALLSVRTPNSPLWNPPPHCKSLHHLATPKLPSVFFPLDAPRPTIWIGDLQLSPHFGHGTH